jgi:hypothetical protein
MFTPQKRDGPHKGKTNKAAYDESRQKIESVLKKYSLFSDKIMDIEKLGVSFERLKIETRLSPNTLLKQLNGTRRQVKKHKPGLIQLGLVEKHGRNYVWVENRKRHQAIKRIAEYTFQAIAAEEKEKTSEEIGKDIDKTILIFLPIGSAEKPKYVLTHVKPGNFGYPSDVDLKNMHYLAKELFNKPRKETIGDLYRVK